MSLNDKLWIWLDRTPEGDFTTDLSLCFKWLVPKLMKEKYHISLIQSYAQLPLWEITSVDYKRQYRSCAEATALALCLAIERLIDSEVRE